MNYIERIERELLNYIFYSKNEKEIKILLKSLKAEFFREKTRYKLAKYIIERKKNNLLIDFEHFKETTPNVSDEEINNIIINKNLEIKPEEYLKELINNYSKEFINKKIKTIDTNKENIHTILQDIDKGLKHISRLQETNEPLSFKEIKEDVLLHIEETKRKAQTEGIVGLSTGIYELDEITGGLKEREYIIVAARPSMGKTALLLTIVKNIIENSKDKTIVIFSIEMGKNELILRLISMIGNIPLSVLMRGMGIEAYQNKINIIIDMLSKINLYIYDNPNQTINSMNAYLHKVEEKTGKIDIAAVDYLQLISPENKYGGRTQQIDDISRGCKQITRDFNLPFIVLSQLNRSLENRLDKRPMLSDIRESGGIEQDADKIIFLYRHSVYKIKELKEQLTAKGPDQDLQDQLNRLEQEKYGETELIIAKNRNDKIGTAKTLFQKNTSSFLNLKENPKKNKEIVSYEEIEYKTYKTESGDPLFESNSIDMPPI